MINIQLDSDHIYTVSKEAISMSEVIKGMFDDLNEQKITTIPISKIEDAPMEKIIEFCTYYIEHKDLAIRESIIARKISNPWVAEFCSMPIELLTYTIRAADFLHIKDLVNILCLEVANRVRGKTAEEIQEMYKNVKKLSQI